MSANTLSSHLTCLVPVDDGLLLPGGQVLALLVDEVHGVVEAPVAHGDGPHGTGLQERSQSCVGGGRMGLRGLTMYPSILLIF